RRRPRTAQGRRTSATRPEPADFAARPDGDMMADGHHGVAVFLNRYRNHVMPLLNVQIMQGHQPAQKSALLAAACQAVVDSIGAPLSSVRVVLEEVPAAHVIVAGELGRQMALVTVDMIAGRTDEQKEALIGALNRAV